MFKDAKVLLVISITLLAGIILSGCATKVEDQNKFDVVFESDVVDLIEYEFEYHYDNGNTINQVDVNGRISNKINRMITVLMTCKFYDSNDEFLGEKTYIIQGLRGTGLPGSQTSFTISYNQQNVVNIDHVDIYASETVIE